MTGIWAKTPRTLVRFPERIKRIFTSRKRQAVPLQAWSGPEGSRKLRFPDYVTTAQDGGSVHIVYIAHSPSCSLGTGVLPLR